MASMATLELLQKSERYKYCLYIYIALDILLLFCWCRNAPVAESTLTVSGNNGAPHCMDKTREWTGEVETEKKKGEQVI